MLSKILFALSLGVALAQNGPDRTETVSGTSGSISSANYGTGHYLIRTKHRWVINAPQGMVISVHFNSPFNLEKGYASSACYDYLNVWSGNSMPSMQRCLSNSRPSNKYCGTSTPYDITSTTNKLVLEFCSDSDVNKLGFSLNWSTSVATTQGPTTSPGPTSCGVPAQLYPEDIHIINGTVQASKIVGGTHAPPHSWPWAVALFTESQWSSTKYQFCGGTLIAPNWVLTAAHCFHGETDVTTGFWAKVGADHKQGTSGDPTLPNESTQQVCTLVAYFEHPQYNSGSHSHDMTLLKLNCHVQYNDAVKPACLPTATENKPATGEEVVTIGWGTLSAGGSASPVLREVVLSTISNAMCNSEYGAGAIDNTMFCCLTAGKDSCQGDSGDGVFSYVNGRWETVGIVSWGRGCAEATYAGVYGKVIPMLGFLQSTMASN